MVRAASTSRRLRHLTRSLCHDTAPCTTPAASDSATEEERKKEWSIAIHGGAGVMVEAGSAQEQEYHETLERSIRAGAVILEAGVKLTSKLSLLVIYGPFFLRDLLAATGQQRGGRRGRGRGDGGLAAVQLCARLLGHDGRPGRDGRRDDGAL
jgi:hypothetical protein